MGKPNRIREWRDRRGMTLEQLAEQAGISVSYLSRMESGDRNVSLKNVGKLTGPLRVRARDLVEDDEATFTIQVAGLIGAGAEILMDAEQIGPEGLEEIELTIPIARGALAFRVYGDSMWPRYDAGDVVICGRDGMDVDQVLNWEAAVRTTDGRRFLKRVRRGSKRGLFNLESHNAEPMRDVGLEWVSGIEHVVRAGQWKSMTPAARSKIAARTKRKA